MKIYYKCKNKIIKEFFLNKFDANFGDILDFFYKDIKKEYNNKFQLKSKYFFNAKELEQKDVILDLLVNEGINMYNVKLVKLEIYLDEIYKIIDEDLSKYNKLIIPYKKDDSLQIYIYSPGKGNINIEEYHKNIFDEYSLNKINNKTSFCNSHNYLFLSGGEYNHEIITDFWIINNNNYSIKCLKIPSPKSEHSMLNIKDDYILIIGGNDTKTYLYNIIKNEFIFWENTNYIHLNPSVILFNNYIYCFSEQNQKIIAEKKIFSLEKNIWENIDISFINSERDNNIIMNDSLLIIFDNKKYYEFNPEKNIIEAIKINNEENYEINICSNDKNFYKLNKYYSACLPKNFNEEKILYVLNKKLRKFHTMHFEAKKYEIKNQYQEKNYEINKENFLKIIAVLEDEEKEIQPLIRMNSLKRILKDKDYDENGTTNLDKEIIINNLSLQKEENNEFEHKSSKNNINFIIPKNVLYDQLIHRTSNVEEDDAFIEQNKKKNLLHIDLDNLANGTENIFTPIKRELPSPYLQQPINQGNKEESIIFEQSMENQSENFMDTSYDKKPMKKNSKLMVSNDMIGEQFIFRDIKNNNDPIIREVNKDISNEPIQKEEDKKDLLEENNNKTKIDSKDINDENKKEDIKNDIDLFISNDAFAI